MSKYEELSPDDQAKVRDTAYRIAAEEGISGDDLAWLFYLMGIPMTGSIQRDAVGKSEVQK